MKLTELDQYHWETGDRIAVIETPANSRMKIDYDPDREIFHAHHLLPEGLSFPFDFGFIPRTRAADGDPLDVVVLTDQPGFPGLVIGIRLLGVFQAEQTEKKKTFRNDRLIACGVESTRFANVNTAAHLGPKILKQFEEFFIFYNRMRGKNFRVLRRGSPAEAEKLIKASESGPK